MELEARTCREYELNITGGYRDEHIGNIGLQMGFSDTMQIEMNCSVGMNSRDRLWVSYVPHNIYTSISMKSFLSTYFSRFPYRGSSSDTTFSAIKTNNFDTKFTDATQSPTLNFTSSKYFLHILKVQSLDMSKQCLCTFVDLVKAFDTVYHFKLLDTL